MAGTPICYDYQSEIIRTDDGLRFGRRTVPSSVLADLHEQIIFDGQRRGLLASDSGNVSVRETPEFLDSESDQIDGVILSIGEADRQFERRFDLSSFESFVSVITADLLKNRLLLPTDRIDFRVFATPAGPQSDSDVQARVCRAPLAWSEGVLNDWLSVGAAQGPVNEADYPLFILDEALEQAHRLSWESHDKERGCWLLGNLFRQRKPRHELFAVVHTVLEAHGVNHTRFGLELTSETYHKFQSQVKLRRARVGRDGELEMGFYHTHPFLPSELEADDVCSRCEKRSECQISSTFLSTSDARFHKAVFGRAPYAIQIVVGLTPREELDLRVYCLDGGKFRERGFYSVSDPPAHFAD